MVKKNPRHKEIIKRVKFNDLPLSRTKKKSKGFSVPLLTRTQDWFDSVISKYSKSFFVRLDVRYPASDAQLQYDDTNKLFSQFLNVLKRIYRRKKIRVDYLWVREQDSSTHHHYHLILVLDGNIIQSEWPVMKEAQRIWELKLDLQPGVGDGLVHLSKLEVNKIIRTHFDDKDDNSRYFYGKVFEAVSYLAKIHSKSTPKSYNEFGHSRVPGLTPKGGKI